MRLGHHASQYGDICLVDLPVICVHQHWVSNEKLRNKALHHLPLDIFSWLLYALYSRSQRGHLFHFSRLVCLPESPKIWRNGGKAEDGTTEEVDIMVKKYEECLDV